MDAITHGLVGGLIARLGPTEKLGGAATAAGAVAAIVPDIDYILFLQGPGAYYCHHRGATHSIMLGVLLCAFIAGFANAATGKKAYGAFFGVALAGFLSHLLLDALTPFGTQVFFPFSERRLAFDTLGYVDPWLSIIAFVAIVVGFSPRHRARAALFGLALVVGYVGGCIAVRQLAIRKVREEAASIANVQRVDVLPVPMLPFAWYGVIDAKAGYYVYDVRGAKVTPVSFVEKAIDSRWVQLVKNDPVSRPFVQATRFPVIKEVVDDLGHHIRVHDLGIELTTGRQFFVLHADITPAPQGGRPEDEQVGIQVLLKGAAETGN